MHLWFIFLIGFTLGSHAWAAGERTMNDWFLRVADDPVAAWEDFQKQKSKSPSLHEQTVDCFLRLGAMVKPCSFAELDQLINHLKSQPGHTEEIFYAKETKVKYQLGSGQFDKAKPDIERLIQYSTSLKNDDYLLRAYILLGTFLQSVNLPTESLSNFNKAQKVLERNQIKDPINRHIALMEFAMSMPNLKILSQGPQEIYTDAVAYFDSKKLRRSSMLAHFNLAAMILDESNTSVRPEAREHFQKAADLARLLKNTGVLGSILLGFARVDQLERNYESAESKIKEVIPILESTNPDWLPHAYTQLGEVRKIRGRFEESLQALDKAETLAEGGPEIYSQNIRSMKMEILEKLHRFEPAYLILKKHHEKTVKDLQEKSKAEYNKMTVDLGLAVEEEKSRLLVRENQQEKQISSYKSIVLISACVLIFLLGFGLLWLKIQRDKIRILQQHIHETVLQRFFPPTIIQQVVAGSTPFDQPAQESVITVLFCDLVDFTHSSERLGAQNIALVLNDFFKEVTEEIFASGGTIDKFIGDAVMVLFGVPIAESPQIQAQKAFECSQRILDCVQRLNRHWQKDLGIEFAIRVGMHQGPAIVGAFGSQKRSDYTAIGLNVNIAARIEAKAMPNSVTMSAAVAQHLPHLSLRPLGPTSLRGVSQSIELFEYTTPESAAA